MSSTTSTYYHTPMPSHHHFNLRMILRSANERYHIVAETFRKNLQLSHHARKRAQERGLEIDTARATRCPQKLVSVLPLHEIDTSVSPTLNRAASEDMIPVIPAPPVPVVERPVVPRITVPFRVASRPFVGCDASVSRTNSEPYEIFAPVALRGQANPWRGPTSRFSITPNDEVFQVNKPVIPDLPQDMTEGEDDSPSPSSSSESSSSGPSTPEDYSSLLIRFKRKSLEVEDEIASAAEKRPKYARKEWNQCPSQCIERTCRGSR
ncbi:hypothetical protein GGU10DRAFT_385257 [Lentinula aff. detonsa]|uniref:Uncharacterized protein n=1 Tax=Lentinula aff. detonsa TaxID=2804958 RepID=A0AA38L5X4_9AGAR|nr:hypothetical protein GGU10DRAFT_385257 [Lentinula aff. detonsa]